MTDYYNKYLKYKSKYINLKRDSGFLDNTIQELYLAKNKNFICKNYNSSFVNKTKYMNLKSSNRQTGGYLQKGNYQIGGVNLDELPPDLLKKIADFANMPIGEMRLINREIYQGLADAFFRTNTFNIYKVQHLTPEVKEKIHKLTNVSSIDQLVDFTNHLTSLTFGRYFNQPVDNLPKTLTHLTFGDVFNQRVDNLPESITHLTFDYYFNQPVDNLPKSLTHLTFGSHFNQSVDDNLPQTLTHLTFGRNFNQPVNNLPPNLTHLTFGYMFNQQVDKLPPNLTHLTFGYRFNQSVDKLPQSLEYIKIPYLNFEGNYNELQDKLQQ